MGTNFTRIALASGLAAALSLPAAAATSNWQIDPQHSSAQFSVRHMAISTVRGAFNKVTGTIALDDKDIAKSTVDVTIDVTTVDTHEPSRDNDLRSDKFFDVAHFPTMTFKSKKSRAARSRQTQSHWRPHHPWHHQGSRPRRRRPDRSDQRSLGLSALRRNRHN